MSTNMQLVAYTKALEDIAGGDCSGCSPLSWHQAPAPNCGRQQGPLVWATVVQWSGQLDSHCFSYSVTLDASLTLSESLDFLIFKIEIIVWTWQVCLTYEGYVCKTLRIGVLFVMPVILIIIMIIKPSPSDSPIMASWRDEEQVQWYGRIFQIIRSGDY